MSETEETKGWVLRIRMTAFVADFAMKSQFLDISYMLLVSGQGSKEYCEVV